MLVSDLITEIKTQIGGDADDTDLDAILLVHFKAGLRAIPAYINERAFLAEDSMTVNAGLIEKSLAEIDGFVKERFVWYVGSDGARIPILRPDSIGEFHRSRTTTSPGKPLFYRIFGSTIGFDKPTDEQIVVGFDYFMALSAIIAGSTMVGTEKFHEAAKKFCMMEYFRFYEEDEGKAAGAERLGKELVSQLEADYEEQEQGGHVEEKT